MCIADVMDMSFARRRKAKPDTTTPDLSVLLAEMSARQGSSRTAILQSHGQSNGQSPVHSVVADPLVDIFAPVGRSPVTTHQFSDQIANPVIPRKLK